MSEVAGRKVLNVGGVEFTVKELCVAEIRSMIASEVNGADRGVDLLGDFLLEGLRLRDLETMTTLKSEQIERMLPSQLEEVVEHCKSMNRLFFEMEARVSKRLQKP